MENPVDNRVDKLYFIHSKKKIKNPCGYPQAYKQLLENFSTKKEQQKI